LLTSRLTVVRPAFGAFTSRLISYPKSMNGGNSAGTFGAELIRNKNQKKYEGEY
jgi:hypothetical protein